MDFFVVDEVSESWASENIPDDDLLYMRVHRNLFDKNGNIFPGAFKNRPTPQDGMSTDWEKYARPEETRSRGRSPKDNAIIQMIVRKVRLIPGQNVVHTPDLVTPNRAHTDVFGEKNPEARVKFSRIFEIVIPLGFETQ
jgi:hypothetical protein